MALKSVITKHFINIDIIIVIIITASDFEFKIRLKHLTLDCMSR